MMDGILEAVFLLHILYTWKFYTLEPIVFKTNLNIIQGHTVMKAAFDFNDSRLFLEWGTFS